MFLGRTPPATFWIGEFDVFYPLPSTDWYVKEKASRPAPPVENMVPPSSHHTPVLSSGALHVSGINPGYGLPPHKEIGLTSTIITSDPNYNVHGSHPGELYVFSNEYLGNSTRYSNPNGYSSNDRYNHSQSYNTNSYLNKVRKKNIFLQINKKLKRFLLSSASISIKQIL